MESWPKWNLCGYDFVGGSSAGIATSIAVPEIDACFDVAQGLPYAFGINNFLISHGHMDHASGIPYIISQKALNKHKQPKFFVPENLCEPLRQIMKIWMKIEGHEYDGQFIPVTPGEKHFLKGDYFFKAFETVHRVQSQGYTIFRQTKKLKKDFLGLKPHEIVRLKAKGTIIEDLDDEPIVSFTGDTQIEFLDRSDWVKRSRILMLEVTYLDERRSVEKARHWGHLHLDELIPRLKDLDCEKICFIHLSKRYSFQDAKKIIAVRVPPQYLDRIFLAPPAFL